LVGYRDENLNSCTLNSAGDGCASATGDCVYAEGIASSDVCVANPGFSEEETVVGDGGDAVRDWEPGRDSHGAAVAGAVERTRVEILVPVLHQKRTVSSHSN